MDKKPEASEGIEYRRAEGFGAQYANNVFFESSLWDLKLTFGESDQSLGPNVVIQHGSVTIPWPQAKVLFYFIQSNIAAYEARNGRIVLQSGIIPPVPKEVPKEFANDPLAIKTHKIVSDLQKRFFTENPEAAPEPHERK